MVAVAIPPALLHGQNFHVRGSFGTIIHIRAVIPHTQSPILFVTTVHARMFDKELSTCGLLKKNLLISGNGRY